MSENRQQVTKKQHYVPQFLLRYFALPGAGERIAAFRIREEKHFPNAAIRDSADQNHFYGDQEIEKGPRGRPSGTPRW